MVALSWLLQPILAADAKSFGSIAVSERMRKDDQDFMLLFFQIISDTVVSSYLKCGKNYLYEEISTDSND